MEQVEFAGTRLALVRESSVRKHLPLAAAIEDLRTALADGTDADAANIPRIRSTTSRPDRAWLHTLRARLDSRHVAGGKDYTSIGFTTPALWVTVVDTVTGLPVALIEADHLSRLRTAAVTALATDLLAPREPRCLAHFGAGKISQLLVRGVLHVRPSLRQVLLVRRDRSRGEPDWLSTLRHEGVDCRLVDTAEAVEAAELVTTATSSKDPVIPPGAPLPRLRHLNLVGSNHLKRREIAEDLARRCLPGHGFLVADDPRQAAAEAGDFAALEAWGELRWEEVDSLRDLVRSSELQHRAHKANITAFKSVGIGLMDLIVACGLLQRLGILQP